MFEDRRRQKAYLWYARLSELNRIQFWQSVVGEVDGLQFRRDPHTRAGRLCQEMSQLERELGRDYLCRVAKTEQWSGLLPDWLSGSEAKSHRPSHRAG